MKSPEYAAKMAKGPIVIFTVSPGGSANMGTQLALWFLYSVVIGIFAAYVTGRALGPGADYRRVFQICGAVTFMGYAMALPQNSIWWKRGWGFTLRSNDRRADLRRADGRHVRLALAAVAALRDA